MKTQEIDMGDGDKFIIQEGMSFMQRNKLMSIFEDYADLGKVKKLDTEKEVELVDISKILKPDKKVLDFTNDLQVFLLTNIVIEPKVTQEMLNDPDVDSTALYVLGTQLMKLGFEAMAKSNLLKKTLKKLSD